MVRELEISFLPDNQGDFEKEELEAIEWSQEKISYWDEMLKRVEDQCRMERKILLEICKEIHPENLEINSNRIDMAIKNGTNIVILSLNGKKVRFDFADITLAKIERNYPSEVTRDMVYNLISELLNNGLNS